MIRTPKGFLAAGAACGIRTAGRADVGVLVSAVPAACSAAFTSSLLRSHSITVSERHLRAAGAVRCILANSGCANTATGPAGLRDTERVCAAAAQELGVRPDETLIASTGVIGEPLPADRMIQGVRLALKDIRDGAADYQSFARAIMTTDTKPKLVADTFRADGTSASVVCAAKGAGMIGPDLRPHATMLVFFVTDAAVRPAALHRAMAGAVVPEFNAFSIDADMSPNDTVFLAANGMSGMAPVAGGAGYRAFGDCLRAVSRAVVGLLLADGEGVTRVVTLVVHGCRADDALRIARTIASSPLVKTAINGADPNWGRFLSAACRSGVRFDVGRVDMSIGPHRVVRRGATTLVPDRLVREVMLRRAYTVTLDIRRDRGVPPVVFRTTDLSKEYVRINAEYKT
jgi:glutamate N-acetyltransferase/amino-acid N-acetyltransferase